MDIQRSIRVIMADKKIKIGDVADRTGVNPRTLSSQLSRVGLDMRLSSVNVWIDAIGCDLVIRDRATGKIYDIGSVAPVGDIGAVDSGLVTLKTTPKNKSQPINKP